MQRRSLLPPYHGLSCARVERKVGACHPPGGFYSTWIQERLTSLFISLFLSLSASLFPSPSPPEADPVSTITSSRQKYTPLSRQHLTQYGTN